MLTLKKIEIFYPKNQKQSFYELPEYFFLKIEKTLKKIQIIARDVSFLPAKSIDFVFTLENFSYETMFCHGFQSWTYSREYSLNEKIPPLRFLRPLLLPYGEAHFYSPKGNLFSASYTYFRKDEEILFLGSLLEKQAYTFFAYNKETNELIVSLDTDGLNLKPNSPFLEIYYEKGNLKTLFLKYANLLKIPAKKIPFSKGYTSWYNLYNKINESYLLEVLYEFSARKIPLDYFQIDDGWQNKVGDWLLVNKKFPSGMAFLSEKIKQANYKAGLWLAPFIAEKNAEIIKKNPQFLLLNQDGHLVKAGFNPLWSYTFYALNWQKSEVQDYLSEVFKTVFQQWNFDMVKLDFLYAAALIPQNGKSRAQLMEEALLFLRKLCPKKVILGCGVPLVPAAGKVDFCRIGSDVGLKWEDGFLKFCNFRERVSVINSLTSTLSRNHQNQIFYGNDPDVFILRHIKDSLSKRKIALRPQERYTLYLLNLIFGQLVFTSDNPKEYSPEELQLYYLQFPWPKIEVKRQIFKENLLQADIQTKNDQYLLLSNLSTQKKSVSLANSYYFCREKKEFYAPLTKIELLPHESLLLFCFNPNPYAFAGSLSHLLPGSEFTVRKLSPQGLKVSYEKKAILREELYFVGGPKEIRISPQWQMEIRQEKNLTLWKFSPVKYF